MNALKQSATDTQTSQGDTLAEGKARWDAAIGMTSTPISREDFVYLTPTGFPLATVQFHEYPNGRYRAFFGQPVALQRDWIEAYEARCAEPVLNGDRADGRG